MLSRIVALTPDASSPLWFGWWIMFRFEPCFATCPRKNKDNPPAKTKTIMQGTISCQLLKPCSRWEVAPHVEKLARVGGNVTPTNPNSSNTWWFDSGTDCWAEYLLHCLKMGRAVLFEHFFVGAGLGLRILEFLDPETSTPNSSLECAVRALLGSC